MFVGATNAQPLLFTTCAEILANCQVASLKDTIRRDMREVAEETSATAAARSLGMTTELAKREARITQLGSRIEDLQVQQCMWSVFPGHPFRVVSGPFSFPCPASGRTPKTECLRRQQLKRRSTSTPLSSRTLCVGFAELGVKSGVLPLAHVTTTKKHHACGCSLRATLERCSILFVLDPLY